MQGIIQEGLKRGKVERLRGELDYHRFKDPFRRVERGTVIIGRRVIWGFPHIKRIFTLEKGLERNIKDGSVFVEEKIDGFNVRIASVRGRIFGFSRGGFLDSFITEKAREMGLEGFFSKHPGYVLCGEMIGNTPYTEPTDEFDVRLFVFDIDSGDGSYLSPQERYDLLKKSGITCVPRLGRFESGDTESIRRVARSLEKGRKEGMVIKSADRKQAVKYVTPSADINDILGASDRFLDMPSGFYYQRVMRSAFFISDFGLGREKHAKELGRAFYDGLMEAIAKVRAGREIDSEFEILVRDPRIWDEIRGHKSKDVGYELLWKRKEKGRTRIRFRKIYWKTTRTLSSLAAGKGVTD